VSSCGRHGPCPPLRRRGAPERRAGHLARGGDPPRPARRAGRPDPRRGRAAGRAAAVDGPGGRYPAYCTANGRALLATLSEPALEAVLPRRLPRLTSHTITTRADLLAELARVRAAGIAFDREEHTERIRAVGAPSAE
jgi:Bacterial transcriptional regulator